MEHTEQNIAFTNSENVNKEGESTFNQAKTAIADKLYSTARKLHQVAAPGEQQSELSGFGRRAADWLETSADYVNNVEPKHIRRDFEGQVRQNPGRSLLIAGAVGLVLGGLLRRR